MSRRVGRNAFTAVVNDIVLLAARVVIGGIFVAHGLRKYNNGFGSTQKMLEGFGVPSPEIGAQVVTYLEIIGGGLLVLGLLAPLAGIVLAAEMAATVYYAHPIRVVFVDVGGWELAAALGAGALALGLVAPGRITLDHVLTWPARRRAARRQAEEDEAEIAETQPLEGISVRHF